MREAGFVQSRLRAMFQVSWGPQELQELLWSLHHGRIATTMWLHTWLLERNR